MKFIGPILNNIENLDRSPKVMRKFGFLLSLILAIFSGMIIYKHSSETLTVSNASITFAVLAILILMIAISKPLLLRPLNTVMLIISMIIGTIMTKILLGILFFTLFTGISIFLKLFGKDKMQRKLDRDANTYWILRKQEPFNPERCKHLF